MQGYPDYPVNGGLISLHPTIFNDPSRVLDVLLHEMIHAIVPKADHRVEFRVLAKRVGLTGKMTATVAGPELKHKLDRLLADRLAPMPSGYGRRDCSASALCESQGDILTLECTSVLDCCGL